MSADLQACAAKYLLARTKHQRALAAAYEAKEALRQVEKEMIDAIKNAPGEDSEDGAVAFVHGGAVIMVCDEYWNLPPGEKLRVEKLIGGAPC